MKKLILVTLLFIGSTAFAQSNRYCGNCYNPYPLYHSQPYVVSDKVESMCITKLSACTVQQKGASFFYQFTYGYKENRVMIFSNGKTTRYTKKDVAHSGTFVDMADLKTENANVAVGSSDNKVRDEKSYAIEACRDEQKVWRATYDFCN